MMKLLNMAPAEYFKLFRNKLGFSNQGDTKTFLSAKDIEAPVSPEYVEQLTVRLCQIIRKMDAVIVKDVRPINIDCFIADYVTRPAAIICNNGVLPKLNNQGRRPEDVLFSWLRGYVIMEYFSTSIAKIFKVDPKSVCRIGEDDFNNLETFKRTPTADLSVNVNKNLVHLEIQSGFQGVNDIKEHKLREARRLWAENGIATVCVHFDIFNGQVAFVRLDQIDENDIHMVTRQQMEGQSVFSIDQNFFAWRLLDSPPALATLDIGF